MKSEIVTDYFFDYTGSFYGKYSPDTETINKKIIQWNEEDIAFCGIFHSHYPCEDHLSFDDIEYITRIVSNLEDYCDYVYFPIVIPKKWITSYKAKIVEGKTVILPDKIEIID